VKKRPRVFGHASISYAQTLESLLKVPIIDGGYPEMGITVESLGKLIESVGTVIHRFPKLEAVLLFSLLTFLSGLAALVICIDEQAKEWLSESFQG
jgi:hypothetical protein